MESLIYCSNLINPIIIKDIKYFDLSSLNINKETVLSINIGNNVLSLVDMCFKDCINLNNVYISSSVTNIGSNCFENCRSLTFITIEDQKNILLYGNSIFKYIYNPISIKFHNCEDKILSLQTLKLVEQNPTNPSLNSIYYCFGKPEETVITSIKNYENNETILSLSSKDNEPTTFRLHYFTSNDTTDFTDFKDFTFNNGEFTSANYDRDNIKNYIQITYRIDFFVPIFFRNDNFFENWVKLIEVYFHKSVKFLPTGTFKGCIKLERICFGLSRDEYFNYTDLNLTFNDKPELIAKKTIEENALEQIGSDCFLKCNNLTSISVYDPSKLNYIGTQVFKNNFKRITVNFVIMETTPDKLYYAISPKWYELFYQRLLNENNEENLLPLTLKILCPHNYSILKLKKNDASSGYEYKYSDIFNTMITSNTGKYKNIIVDENKKTLFEKYRKTIPIDFFNNKLNNIFFDVSKNTLLSSIYRPQTWHIKTVNTYTNISYVKDNDGNNTTDVSTYDHIVENSWNDADGARENAHTQKIITSYTMKDNIYDNIITFPDDIKNNIVEIWLSDGINNIPYGTFNNLINLTAITFPSNPIALGSFGDKIDALGNNISISGINVMSCFKNCVKLVNLINMDKILNIGINTFSMCTNLMEFISNNITIIPKNCFSECTSLTKVDVPNCKYIGDWAFNRCVNLTQITFNNSLTHLGNGAFLLCEKLSNITNLASVMFLGHYCFDSCKSLSNIIISSSELIELNEGTFQNCIGLKMFDIPSKVGNLKDMCFHNCRNLTSITYSSNITNIGIHCFSDCISLINFNIKGDSSGNVIRIPQQNTKISIGCFQNCINIVTLELNSQELFESKCFQNCSNLLKIRTNTNNIISDNNIPSTINSLNMGCFAGCINLTSINMAQSLFSVVPDEAFNGCNNITSVILPSSVTTINRLAFYKCYNLREIIFPAGLTEIEDFAFSGCLSVRSYTIPDNVTSLGLLCFSPNVIQNTNIDNSGNLISGLIIDNNWASQHISPKLTNINFNNPNNISNIYTNLVTTNNPISNSTSQSLKSIFSFYYKITDGSGNITDETGNITDGSGNIINTISNIIDVKKNILTKPTITFYKTTSMSVDNRVKTAIIDLYSNQLNITYNPNPNPNPNS